MSTTTGRSPRTSPGAGTVPTRQQLDELDALLQRMLDLPVHQAEEPLEGAPVRPQPTGLKGPAPRSQPVLRPAPAPKPVAPPEPPPAPAPERTYPPSYMVVEDSMPGVSEPPVPGGRHDLVEGGLPADPVQEQAQARLRETAEPQGQPWVPFQTAWQPSAQTWGPLAETWRAARPTELEPEQPQPPVMPPFVPPPPLPPSLQAETPSVWTQTVVVSDPPAPAEGPAAAPPAEKSASAPPVSPLMWPLIAFNACFDLCLWPLGPVGAWLRGPTGRGMLGGVGVLCLIGAAVVAALDGFGWTW